MLLSLLIGLAAEFPTLDRPPTAPAARTEGVEGRPQVFMAFGDYAEWLHQTVAENEARETGAACPETKTRSLAWRALPHAEAPAALVAARGPSYAVVSERVRVEGCGRARTVNLVVTGPPDYHARFGRPGYGRADPRTDEQVMLLRGEMVRAFHGLQPMCDPLRDREVEVTREPDREGAWTERWTLEGCGRSFPVEAAFRPGPGGRLDYTLIATWDGRTEVRKGPAETRPRWTLPDLSPYYPSAALAADVEGRSVLRCRISAEGYGRDCEILSETPAGYGFGAAHLKVMEIARVRPDEWGGKPVETWGVMPLSWRLAD
ncbi:MAG TPA: TonB family protein [Caulobacteraceae bacterium]|nr:TonB family protein [Caulobacteraceae bacterium]